jgi:hypothetical protein
MVCLRVGFRLRHPAHRAPLRRKTGDLLQSAGSRVPGRSEPLHRDAPPLVPHNASLGLGIRTPFLYQRLRVRDATSSSRILDGCIKACSCIPTLFCCRTCRTQSTRIPTRARRCLFSRTSTAASPLLKCRHWCDSSTPVFHLGACL